MKSPRTIVALFFFIVVPCRASMPCAAVSGDWAQETLNRLTVDEKIGQLLVPAVIINPDLNDADMVHAMSRNDQTPVDQMIKNYHLGGLLFDRKSTNPAGQIEFTRACQAMSDIPLLIMQDLEWGLSMRLKDVVVFPHNMTLGALQNEELIYQMGVEVGRECALLGVHMNFAPVVDVNNNPNNPIINMRSFGEDPYAVARKGELFMRGLHDGGVLSCAKHFPGHGDTEVDSHEGLPVLNQSLDRLQRVELVPFKTLIEAGVPAVMVGHLAISAFDASPCLPATLSHRIVTTLLKRQFNFNGLIITDALNMEGVLKHHKPGELELMALYAGADILLCLKNNHAALDAIRHALATGMWSMDELDKRVYKILCAKERIRAQGTVDAPVESIVASLHDGAVLDLRQQLYDEAITVVRNEGNVLPMVGDISVACVQIQSPAPAPVRFTTTRSFDLTHFEIAPNVSRATMDEYIEQFMEFDIVAVGIHELNNNASARYGLSDATLYLFDALAARGKKVVAVVFGTPYSLKFFEHVPAVVAAYEDEPAAMWAAAQVIFGSHAPKGKLPVSASAQYPAGCGLTW